MRVSNHIFSQLQARLNCLTLIIFFFRYVKIFDNLFIYCPTGNVSKAPLFVFFTRGSSQCSLSLSLPLSLFTLASPLTDHIRTCQSEMFMNGSLHVSQTFRQLCWSERKRRIYGVAYCHFESCCLPALWQFIV